MKRSVTLLAAMAVGSLAISISFAADFYVENANPSCSNSGSGTPAVPYCAISAAIAAHHGPGVRILVRPGVYREQVGVPASGSVASPFVLQGLGPSVVIDGADNYSNAAQWVLFSGSVFLAASVPTSPIQVFVDNARQISSIEAPAAIPPGSFRFIAGEGLYLSVGGDNPGVHATFVGQRTNGVRVTARSYVTIQGLSVTRSEDNGIYINSGCTNVQLLDNAVTWAGNSGIAASGGSAVLIARNTVEDNGNHGINMLAGITDSTAEDNQSARNARATTRAGNGIKLDVTARIVVQRNLTHDNKDSGIQFNHATQTTSLLNRSWDNSDHGYDHLDAHDAVHIGDLAFRNFKDGFSTEGSSTDVKLFDAVSIDNGLTTGRFDEWVDADSTAGYAADSNILWNSTAQPPIKWGSTVYATIAAFTVATSQDAHSIQQNPLLNIPPAGLFEPLAGSPAIDSADSSVVGCPATDAQAHERVDDPSTPNTGLGPVPYADRGPLEYVLPCLPERCDGIDNDCDGTVDNGFNIGASCVVGLGACSASGSRVCSADQSSSVCSVSPGAPSPEDCDSVDDDCDGTVDNGFGVGVFCTAGTGACERGGMTACSPDHQTTVCGAEPGPPSAETCDGIDNDCDGTIDNVVVPVGSPALNVTRPPAGGSGLPSGGSGLVPDQPVMITWSPLAGSERYDVVKGDLILLSATLGDFRISTTECLTSGTTGTNVTDEEFVGEAAGRWYLVRGANCAGPGSYDSGNPSQVGSRDAEIALSPNACP